MKKRKVCILNMVSHDSFFRDKMRNGQKIGTRNQLMRKRKVNVMTITTSPRKQSSKQIASFLQVWAQESKLFQIQKVDQEEEERYPSNSSIL